MTTTQSPADAPVGILLDLKAVSQMCNCSGRHFLRLADRGDAPWGRKLGAVRRWSREEIVDWIRGGCKPVYQSGRRGQA
jgi:predicted DNA-binding transcriptional regulator AlpA